VGKVEVHKRIESVLSTFTPFLKDRDVKPRTEFGGGAPYLQGTDAALESIVTNLLNNSVAAFERGGTGAREVVFRTELMGRTLVLRVLDTGPGIEDVDMKDIWSPGITSQPNGTGLGLTIVRDAVTDLGGSVSALAHGELGGAEFRLELPLLGW
jgi:C4-dicarboxylate-specific signal transduction histidine kinase